MQNQIELQAREALVTCKCGWVGAAAAAAARASSRLLACFSAASLAGIRLHSLSCSRSFTCIISSLFVCNSQRKSSWLFAYVHRSNSHYTHTTRAAPHSTSSGEYFTTKTSRAKVRRHRLRRRRPTSQLHSLLYLARLFRSFGCASIKLKAKLNAREKIPYSRFFFFLFFFILTALLMFVLAAFPPFCALVFKSANKVMWKPAIKLQSCVWVCIGLGLAWHTNCKARWTKLTLLVCLLNFQAQWTFFCRPQSWVWLLA